MFEFGRVPIQFGMQQAKWLGGVARQPVEQAPRMVEELAMSVPRAMRLGKFMTEKTVVVAKPFMLFGAGMAEELLYAPYERGYVDNLLFSAAHDRVKKAYKTARSSLASDKQNDVNRGKFAALDLASAVSTMAEYSSQEAADGAPLVSEIAAKLPDTDEGARIAEQVTAVGLGPIVDNFNQQVLPFRQPDKPQE